MVPNKLDDGDKIVDIKPDKSSDGGKTVEIEVNDQKVKMIEGPASGLEIKQAAVDQGVSIQTNFILQLHLPNGSSKVIGDDDKVDLSEHLAFTAIAADDNS